MTVYFLQQETADFLLFESGDKIVLEESVTTQVVAINGEYLRYMRGNWFDIPGGAYFNGTGSTHRWRRHTLTANVMPESEFNLFYMLEGQKVSLTTTPYGNRNSTYITYYGCDFVGASGTHSGPRFENVTAEFMVLV